MSPTKRLMPTEDDAGFNLPTTSIHRVEADGVQVFYRAAGELNAPVVLLLHGFPTSSFMFRELIPRLASDYRVIAPDLPGFGFTEVPQERQYSYTFDRLALTIDTLTQTLKIGRYAIYVFDYGAPTGFRLAMAHPERITAIVSQNGNAYEEGLGEAWGPIRKYWASPTAENRDILRQSVLTAGGDYGQRGWLPTGGAEFGALHRRELRGLAPLALPTHCVSVRPSQLLGPRVDNRL